MCFIIVKKFWSKKTMEVTKEDVQKIARNNPDGCGCAYLKQGRVVVEKGLSADRAFKLLKKKDCIVLHWRFGTSGEKGKRNIHPFHIHKNGVLFHNGVLFPSKTSDCDSKVFADKVIQPIYQALGDVKMLVPLAVMFKSIGQRWVYFNQVPPFAHIYGSWTNEKGVVCSASIPSVGFFLGGSCADYGSYRGSYLNLWDKEAKKTAPAQVVKRQKWSNEKQAFVDVEEKKSCASSGVGGEVVLVNNGRKENGVVVVNGIQDDVVVNGVKMVYDENFKCYRRKSDVEAEQEALERDYSERLIWSGF